MQRCLLSKTITAIRPGILRVLAANPKPYTGPGTNTYIVGDATSAWILDPGPNLSAHVEAVMQAVAGRQVLGILVTHSHLDHSPAGTPLRDITGAKLYGYGAINQELQGKTTEDVDFAFAPDVLLADGAYLEAGPLSLRVLHTPGHFPNHLCYEWPDKKLLFTGDQAMGWSTTVINPPLGNLADYMLSIEKLLKVEAQSLLPSHGPLVPDAAHRLHEIQEHRAWRHKQVMACLEAGIDDSRSIVSQLYQDVNENLLQAAEGSVTAHIHFIKEFGRVCPSHVSML